MLVDRGEFVGSDSGSFMIYEDDVIFRGRSRQDYAF